MRVFIRCDNHPAAGGPHISRGLFVGPYFREGGANLVMCTHKSKRGHVCGSLQLELPELTPPVTSLSPCSNVGHGDCPAVWAICSCGWFAEFATESQARHVARAHEKEEHHA